jgi:hypothetical protein
MRFAQIYDRVETDASGAGPPDTSALVGNWVNSNPETNGIARMRVSGEGGRLSLRVYAVGPGGGAVDWGEAEVELLTASPSSRAVAGFTSLYDFGFAEVRLQAMIMKGLVVLAVFNTFKDGSGRADYFTREYFAAEHGRY